MDFIGFIGIAFVILFVCVIIVYAYSQQAHKLQEIQSQLAKIESQKSERLRQERAEHIDPLLLLEGSLNQSQTPQLNEDAFQQIDTARSIVNDINQKLVSLNEWMGPPFDLEWTEYLERMPTLRKLYLASSYVSQETPVTSAQIIKQ